LVNGNLKRANLKAKRITLTASDHRAAGRIIGGKDLTRGRSIEVSVRAPALLGSFSGPTVPQIPVFVSPQCAIYAYKIIIKQESAKISSVLIKVD